MTESTRARDRAIAQRVAESLDFPEGSLLGDAVVAAVLDVLGSMETEPRPSPIFCGFDTESYAAAYNQGYADAEKHARGEFDDGDEIELASYVLLHLSRGQIAAAKAMRKRLEDRGEEDAKRPLLKKGGGYLKLRAVLRRGGL